MVTVRGAPYGGLMGTKSEDEEDGGIIPTPLHDLNTQADEQESEIELVDDDSLADEIAGDDEEATLEADDAEEDEAEEEIVDEEDDKDRDLDKLPPKIANRIMRERRIARETRSRGDTAEAENERLKAENRAIKRGTIELQRNTLGMLAQNAEK